MNFIIISCSKSKQGFLKAGEEEYFQRINQVAKIRLVEIPIPDSISKLVSSERIKKEAQLIKDKIKPGGIVVALDENEKSVTSIQLAKIIEREFISGCPAINFIIGGPYGLDQEILKIAKHKISLSSLTFTSQLARLILAEQLYRALSIIKGLPYHKE